MSRPFLVADASWEPPGYLARCPVCGGDAVEMGLTTERTEENPVVLKMVGGCGHQWDLRMERMDGRIVIRLKEVVR